MLLFAALITGGCSGGDGETSITDDSITGSEADPLHEAIRASLDQESFVVTLTTEDPFVDDEDPRQEVVYQAPDRTFTELRDGTQVFQQGHELVVTHGDGTATSTQLEDGAPDPVTTLHEALRSPVTTRDDNTFTLIAPGGEEGRVVIADGKVREIVLPQGSRGGPDVAPLAHYIFSDYGSAPEIDEPPEAAEGQMLGLDCLGGMGGTRWFCET